MKGISLEVILAVAYAAFLVIVSLILEWMGRHTHHRAKGYRVRGFTFHEHLDAWECPQGEFLQRAATESTLPVVRYRARAAGCNACPLKARCTDSDEGRQIENSTEDWLDTEIGRFHRGLSLVLLCLSGLVVIVIWVRHHSTPESALLAITLGVLALTALSFLRIYRKRARPDAPALIQISPWTGGARPDGGKRAKPFS